MYHGGRRGAQWKVRYLPYEPVGIRNCSHLIPILTVFKRGLYKLFAVCLACAKTDDVEAKAVLSRIIRDPTFGTSESVTTEHHGIQVNAKVYLARVLRRLGEDNEAHKLYVEWS